jgi:hypothetical protein
MNLEFGDPIEPFKEAFTQLLAPKILKNLHHKINNFNMSMKEKHSILIL